ncbi:MAG TPA: TadE family protein [Oculatellaceae cyanobacterium]
MSYSRNKRTKLKRWRRRGAQVAEFAASMVLVLPLFVVIFYMTFEAAMYLYLKTGVDAAAKTQARWLAINFNNLVQENGSSASNYSTWINSKVRVASCVVSNSQITNGTISGGTFVTTAPPTVAAGACPSGSSGQGTVAVQVVYPGSTGLPTWPYPPLSLFGLTITPPSVQIAAVYTADIEP